MRALFLATSQVEAAQLPEIQRMVEARQTAGMGNIGEVTRLDGKQARELFPALADVPGAIHTSGGAWSNAVGELLGPYSGAAVTDLIQGKPPAADLAPFGPGRLRRGGERMLGRCASLLQHVANTLHALFGLSVTVRDAQQALLASSGCRADGQVLGASDGPHERTFRSGFKVVILDPGEHRICEDCTNRCGCGLLAELLVPIQSASQSYGSVSLLAHTVEQRRRVVEDQGTILQVADLLLGAVVSQAEATERAEALDRSRAELQHLVDIAQTGIAITDLDGLIVHYNKEFLKVFGLSPEQSRTSHLLKHLKEPQADKLQGLTRQVPFQAISGNKELLEGSLTPLSFRGNRYALVWRLRPRGPGEVMAGTGGAGGKNFTLDDIKGVAPQLTEVKIRAKRAATSDSTILITGESGTGKEVFARAIHNASNRKNGPFVAINCAAIPETLLESELFGYEDGAFSGAKRGGKKGRFEMAQGGTLFLDEIGDMSPDLQAKLLRVLQNRVIERVGGVSPASIDVRIVAATNRNVEERMRQGLFREDLYYRLNVIPLNLPALRERKEDLYILLDFFMKKYALRLGTEPKQFTAEAINCLFQYYWPGNVRELENVIEYVMNLEIGHVVTLQGLPERVRTARTTAEIPMEELDRGGIVSLDQVIGRCVLAAVRHFGYTTDGKRAAAKALGISTATLYRRLNQLNSRNDNDSKNEKTGHRG